jgi:threonyl-tRNA synthetase
LPDVARTELLSADGEVLLEVDGALTAERLREVDGLGDDRALAVVCGVAPEEAGGACTRNDVLAAAEQLEMVSRRGCVRGFLVILPRGMLLEHSVAAFNQPHVVALGATRMDFPLVFDRSDPAVADLTESYERQERMFRVEEPDREHRLAYAADPGLFGWLSGARLDPGALPYAIYSPTPVFRRLQSGEVGGVDRQRQYLVPDVHVLTARRDAVDAYTRCVELAADGARFWFGEDFAQFVEIVDEMHAAEPELGRRAAVAAGRPTVVRVLRRRPRYYAVKGGIVVPGGFAGVMLYNLQLDDTNGERFDVRLADGEPAAIVHATVAGGWPKILPLVLGRGLAGLGPKTLPVELAADQIVCLPIRDEHAAAAVAYAARLREAGLRVATELRFGDSLGARLRRHRAAWQPFHVVIGDREAAGQEPVIASPVEQDRLPLGAFVERFGGRLRRCAVPAPPTADLPFAR